MSTIARQVDIASSSPEITCFADKFIPSPTSDSFADRRCDPEPAPLEAALAKTWGTDAHFAAYAPAIDADSGITMRLANDALAAGIEPEMRLLVIDVDDPIAHAEHTSAGDGWRTTEREKLSRLRRCAPGFLRFETRGGYRLIWALEAPFAVEASDPEAWSRYYKGALEWLKQHSEIEGDERCADWTRLYRLPNVERQGVGPQRAAVEGSLSAVWPADMSRAIDVPAPKKGKSKSRRRATPVEANDPREGDPTLTAPLIAELADVLEPSWCTDGRQDWVQPFLGWMHGKGWAESERAQLLAALIQKRDDDAGRYFDMNERTVALDGPGVRVKEALGEAFAAVDAIVNRHPNSLRAKLERVRHKPATAAENDPTEAPAECDGTIASVATVLRRHPAWHGVLGYDAFACRVLALKEPPVRDDDTPNASCIGDWTDAHTSRARSWLAAEYGDEPGKDATDSAVEIVARAQTFHPVRDYLSRLAWDGTARLDKMLERYFGVAAGRYAELVGAKFMISAVARIVTPGCKVDTMPIFEGPQGIGKSRAVRALAGPEWFADTALDFESKDAAQCLAGKWLYEIGELASFNRSEANRIKAFVSSQSDNLRPSYGRRNVDFPRQCVFVGTTNDARYLTDTTGNRRYWPVRCGRIDVGALERDRDQLWAEAAARHEAGERWWLDAAEERLASEQQAERESEDPWEAAIVKWLADEAAKGKGVVADFTLAAVLKGACGLKLAEQSQAHSQRAGRLLGKLGYESRNRRDPSSKTGYSRSYRRRDEV